LRGIYGRFDSKIRFENESDGRFDSRFDSNEKKTIRRSLLIMALKPANKIRFFRQLKNQTSTVVLSFGI